MENGRGGEEKGGEGLADGLLLRGDTKEGWMGLLRPFGVCHFEYLSKLITGISGSC